MIHLAWGRARSLLLAAVIAAPVAVLVPGLMTRTASAAVLGAAPGSGVPANLRVGSQVLKRCATSPATSPAAFCGTLKVPLDWQSRGGPDISVCYRWYPATGSGRPEGTVLPVEGGPGYPSILSVAPYGFRDMYGCSTVLNCPVLQNYQGPTGTPVFAAVAGTCADALNTRRSGQRDHAEAGGGRGPDRGRRGGPLLLGRILAGRGALRRKRHHVGQRHRHHGPPRSRPISASGPTAPARA